MSKLHLVFGGRVKDPRGLDSRPRRRSTSSAFTTAMPRPKMPGEARRRARVDDAEMKYVVVHLHRLLEPDAEGIARPKQPAA